MEIRVIFPGTTRGNRNGYRGYGSIILEPHQITFVGDRILAANEEEHILSGIGGYLLRFLKPFSFMGHILERDASLQYTILKFPSDGISFLQRKKKKVQFILYNPYTESNMTSIAKALSEEQAIDLENELFRISPLSKVKEDYSGFDHP